MKRSLILLATCWAAVLHAQEAPARRHSRRSRRAARRERPTARARRRLGGLHRVPRGHGPRRGRLRHLDDELGRHPLGSAHPKSRRRARAPLERGRPLSRLPLQPRRPPRIRPALAARPLGWRSRAGNRPARRSIRLRLVAGWPASRAHRPGSRSRRARLPATPRGRLAGRSSSTGSGSRQTRRDTSPTGDTTSTCWTSPPGRPISSPPETTTRPLPRGRRTDARSPS